MEEGLALHLILKVIFALRAFNFKSERVRERLVLASQHYEAQRSVICNLSDVMGLMHSSLCPIASAILDLSL